MASNKKTIASLILSLVLAGFPFQSTLGQSQNSNARQNAHKTKSKKAKKRKMPPPPVSKNKNGSELAVGAWGGDHIQLVSTETGAKIDLDCAHATIEPKIKLDRENCFDVPGSYFKEGPPRPDEQEQSSPARFHGCVRQSTLDLTIKTGNTSGISTFTLVYGRAAQIMKCL